MYLTKEEKLSLKPGDIIQVEEDTASCKKGDIIGGLKVYSSFIDYTIKNGVKSSGSIAFVRNCTLINKAEKPQELNYKTFTPIPRTSYKIPASEGFLDKFLDLLMGTNYNKWRAGQPINNKTQKDFLMMEGTSGDYYNKHLILEDEGRYTRSSNKHSYYTHVTLPLSFFDEVSTSNYNDMFNIPLKKLEV